MRLSFITALLASLLFCVQGHSAPSQNKRVILGDERFEKYIPLIKDKDVAVFSNHTGIVGDKVTESGYGPHLVDVLIDKGISVRAIFSPEHGFRGTADAGETVSSEVDAKTGVEIISLYGGSNALGQKNMDKFDILLVDIQDVGLRYYTYYISMLHLMEACAKSGKGVIVLDRPNPNGFYVDGPILDPEYKSGVGALPITTVHGMTLGELALMINGEGWLPEGLKCDLKIIPCLGYDHSTRYQLVVPPSPNLKTMRAIYLYASTCYFEGTIASLGRGTDNPFEIFGHPDMSSSFTFTPRSVPGAKNPPLKDKLCHGYDLREKPLDEICDEGINLDYIITAFNDLGIGDKFFTSFFDKLAGVGYIREMILSGASAQEIKARWKDDVEAFKARRHPYLLYPDSGPSVTFSDEAGSYKKARKRITLSAPDGYSIHYTTDGSVPTSESPLYVKPLKLRKKGNRWICPKTVNLMTVSYNGKQIYPLRASSRLPGANIIRAIAIAPDGTSGEVTTKTYFIGSNLKKDYKDVMVVSIVTDPDNLLDYETGILAKGRVFDEWVSSPEAALTYKHNYWWDIKANYSQKGKAWERPASIELFDASNQLTVKCNCGIRLRGRLSRMFSQKSLNISLEKPYGDGSIHYPVFPDAVNANTGEVITRYESFSLRNGGNDTEYLKFKDSWIQSRVSHKDLSTQKSRIAILFLNGEYWGHYNLVEKVDDKFFANHYGVDDPLVIKDNKLDEGNPSDLHFFEELMSFCDKDLSIDSYWEAFKQAMDIQNMADYFATEIYIGNGDWKDTMNISLWRGVTIDPSNPYADGRWRFILCDTEYSSSLYNQPETKFEFNSYAYALINHPLFASAMRNPEFQDLFKTTIIEIARNNFDAHDVETDLDAWAKRWKPYMPYYYKRFGNNSWAWNHYLKSTTKFFHRRFDHIIAAIS
ncbi:MAG: DUF1343 domain-containing protein [Bacteroidales bacterium]|nr:DUF1343 domain-containing protein [Bacteroidales bacterium]